MELKAQTHTHTHLEGEEGLQHKSMQVLDKMSANERDGLQK